jgi:hypothetical protein
MVVDTNENKMHWYLNGRESSARNGTGTESPISFNSPLKKYGSEPFYIGHTPSTSAFEPNAFFKGRISDIKFWNRALNPDEISNLQNNYPKDDLVLHYDFTAIDRKQNKLIDLVNGNNGELNRVGFASETISIPYVSLPHRRDGKFLCLPHETEGLVNVGGIDRWAKGETTAANERRYVLQMQQGKINYKIDGMSNVYSKYELIDIKDIFDNHKMINVKTI